MRISRDCTESWPVRPLECRSDTRYQHKPPSRQIYSTKVQYTRTLFIPSLRHTANKRAASTILSETRCALSDYQVVYSTRACQQGWRDDFQSAPLPTACNPIKLDLHYEWWGNKARSELRVSIAVNFMHVQSAEWMIAGTLLDGNEEWRFSLNVVVSIEYWSPRHLFHVLSRFPEPRLITLQCTRRTM